MKTAETKETVLNDEEHRDVEVADSNSNDNYDDEVIEKNSVNILEEDNESHSYDPNRISFYGRPRQRQKWGDTQVLPRANWGCTFFDLFFVGGAYNVGNVLLQDPSGQGVLYFCGCFFVLSSMWLDKTNFDSKFALEDDVFHRCREMLSFLLVAGAVLHIREVEIMSNPCEHPEMFVFALIVCLHLILSMLNYLEIYLFCKGDRFALKASSYQEIKRRLVTFIFFAAATIIAGIEYFKDTNHDDKNSDNNRYLAGDEYSGSSKCSSNNIPICLCLAGFLFENFMLIFIVQIYFRNLGRDGFGSHKKRYVPVNVGFIIHRNSEWNMLMLGESVLSLLIVPSSEGFRYYVAFFSGILTVMLLQYLHYRSQPHDENSHALRRHKDAGVWWRFTYQIYSCSIVAIGVSFKLFMYNFTVQDDYDGDEAHYSGGGDQYNNNTSYGDGYNRMLAGGTSDSFSNRPAMAKIFGIAMATTFFCIDGLTLLHNGLQKGCKRCECQRTKRKNVKGIMLIMLRILVIIFFASLGFYVTNPTSLCLLGVGGCLVQLVIRSLGLIYFADTMHA